MTKQIPQSLYVAFDTYPASKGAAVHIREFSKVLFNHLGSGLLLVLGNEQLPTWQIEDSIEIRRLHSSENNFLLRAQEFGQFVNYHANMLAEHLKIAHFRDPWSGIPILDVDNRKFKVVYEVNALPSIEIPTRYSGVSAQTISKIRALEKRCWEEADAIICPSNIIKKCLTDLGADATKITTIPNGAHIAESVLPELPEGAPKKYLIYFGAVQSWQGIEPLFKAMQFLRDIDNLHLVMCVSGTKRRLKYLQKLARRMEISGRIRWFFKLSQLELQPWLANATISIAPLTECSRNLTQGCCPMKVIESMAHGVPVVASDLPVVREIIDDKKNGFLVRPDRPAELARKIRILLGNSDYAKQIGLCGKEKVVNTMKWEDSADKLVKVYDFIYS